MEYVLSVCFEGRRRRQSSRALNCTAKFCRKLIFALVFGVVMTSFPSLANSQMEQLLSGSRIAPLKRKIDYDEKIGRENSSERVVVDLEKVSSPPQLKSWTKTVRNSVTPSGVHIVSMEFLKDEERVRIILEIYDPKNNNAGNYLLIKADAVSTMEIKDVPGPSDLGTISLMSPRVPPELVYWVFRNVLAEVSVYKTSASSIAIAQWIQQELARSVKAISK